MNEKEILNRLIARLVDMPVFDRYSAVRRFVEDSGWIDLIEAGAALRYDEYGDIPMTYGVAKQWDDALAKFTDSLIPQRPSSGAEGKGKP